MACTNRQDIFFCVVLIEAMCSIYVFEIKDTEHFGFIQFYTDNGSVEPKQTFVLEFFEALKLRPNPVHMGFSVN